MATGVFPKTDGEILFGQDINLMTSMYTTFEQGTASPTDSSVTITYSATMKTHLVKNVGAEVCYINFGGDATTSDWLLNPNETLSIDGDADDIRVISTVTGTTIKVIAMS